MLLHFDDPREAPDIARMQAAAEAMRAMLFFADRLYFPLWLSPLAAALARATAQPLDPPDPETKRESEPRPRAELVHVGGPEPDGDADAAPFLAAIARLQGGPSQDTDDRPLTDLHTVVALTDPSESRHAGQVRQANRILAFEHFKAFDWSRRLDREVILVDRNWIPRRRDDPEILRGAKDTLEPHPILPPFGVLIQQALLAGDGHAKLE